MTRQEIKEEINQILDQFSDEALEDFLMLLRNVVSSQSGD